MSIFIPVMVLIREMASAPAASAALAPAAASTVIGFAAVGFAAALSGGLRFYLRRLRRPGLSGISAGGLLIGLPFLRRARLPAAAAAAAAAVWPHAPSGRLQ